MNTRSQSAQARMDAGPTSREWRPCTRRRRVQGLSGVRTLPRQIAALAEAPRATAPSREQLQPESTRMNAVSSSQNQHTRREAARGPARRGFAMAFVLMLVLVASLMIAATLSRQDAQTRTVHRLTQEYQFHHDMLGAKSIIEMWLFRQRPTELSAMARTSAVDHREIIDGVAKLSVTVEDGQGLPIASTSAIPQAARERYQGILDRYLEQGGTLLRSAGPPLLSAQSAPIAVLAAIVEQNGDDFAEEIDAIRRDEPITEVEFYEVLANYEQGSPASQQLRQIVTFDPVVWRLRITIIRPGGEQQTFGIIAENLTNQVVIHELLMESDLNQLDRAAAEQANHARRGRRASDRRSRADGRAEVAARHDASGPLHRGYGLIPFSTDGALVSPQTSRST